MSKYKVETPIRIADTGIYYGYNEIIDQEEYNKLSIVEQRHFKSVADDTPTTKELLAAEEMRSDAKSGSHEAVVAGDSSEPGVENSVADIEEAEANREDLTVSPMQKFEPDQQPIAPARDANIELTPGADSPESNADASELENNSNQQAEECGPLAD